MGGGASNPQPQPNQNNQTQPQQLQQGSQERKGQAENQKGGSLGPAKTNVIVKVEQKQVKTIVHTIHHYKSSLNKEKKKEKPKAEITNGVIKGIGPLCSNGKTCTMVCLSPQCHSYPFYCHDCPNNCETNHFHSSKTEAVTLNNFNARVSSSPKTIPQLKQSMDDYRQTLVQFKQQIDLYIEKQLLSLEEMAKVLDLSSEAQQFGEAIAKNRYVGMKGKLMFQLWYDSNTSEEQEEHYETVKAKMKNIQQLCQCFSSISEQYHLQAQQLTSPKRERKGQPGRRQWEQQQPQRVYDGVRGKGRAWNGSPPKK